MKFLSRLSTIVFFLCAIPSLTAQDATGPLHQDTEEGSTIVVIGTALPSYKAEESTTATRLPERILDTDRSVQVITEQMIEDRAIVDPQEAVQNVSAVQRGGARTGVGETYFIRGFRQGSLIKDSFRVGELSGGDVFTFEAPTDIANIERIEVLKGPSAILYGRGGHDSIFAKTMDTTVPKGAAH